MAFLSLLDERVRVKGSRDPLGFETVWTGFGRELVGNLTTVTASWRNFAVALLGFHWCHALCTARAADERLAVLQQYFIRYEQLAAYLRSSGPDTAGDVLGITRVRKHLRAETGQVRLGDAPDRLILSNQISYGLWGLYASAMRASDLVSGDERRPTEAGEKIAMDIESALDVTEFMPYITGDRDLVEPSTLERLRAPFINAIEQPAVRRQLMACLLRGSDEPHLQRALYEATKALSLTSVPTTPEYIGALKSVEPYDDLHAKLTQIESLERLLVTANRLFDYCRRKNDTTLSEIVALLEADEHDDQLDFSYIPDRPTLSGYAYQTQLEAIRNALRAGDTSSALQAIFALNRHVMQDRGGAPWIELDGQQRLRVRIPSETSERPTQHALETEWDYSYFLASFARIAVEARA